MSVEGKASGVCKSAVRVFVASDNVYIHSFLFELDCVELTVCSNTEAALRLSVLCRSAIALSFPLTNFASLLTRALSNGCRK